MGYARQHRHNAKMASIGHCVLGLLRRVPLAVSYSASMIPFLNAFFFTRYNAEFIAGGSVQNSLRVAQWILKKPRICTYFGCVGDDDYARILKERAM